MITKQDFESYVELQKSGQLNMCAVRMVCEYTGLEREQVLDIMKNYSKYEKEFSASYTEQGDNYDD